MTGLLVHEWIERRGGSENVLEAISEVFPDAPILTPWTNAPERLVGREIHETILARTPLRRSKPLAALALPILWRRAVPLNLDYDWILVSTHLFAHHVTARGRAKGVPKLAYVHSPARYVWNPDLDARGSGVFARVGSSVLRPIDRHRAQELTAVAANSSFVRDRIRRSWGLDATVIHPPVDVDEVRRSLRDPTRLLPAEEALLESLPPEYLLGVSRFVSYKRLGLVIAAAERSRIPVVLAGGGPEVEALRAQGAAASVPVFVIENPSSPLLHHLYFRALALAFPAIEDFGIVPVEAMAAGTPVIGVARGGLLETVVNGSNGFLLDEFTPAAVSSALGRCRDLDRSTVSRTADRFSEEQFKRHIADWVGEWTRTETVS